MAYRITLDGRAALPTADTAARPATPVTTAGAGGRRLRSADLFGPSAEIEIEHGQAVYRLRRTSLGKLILTK